MGNVKICTTFDVRIEGEMPTAPPRLSLVRTALGAYQLTLTAEQTGMFQIQTSPDLRNWLNWTNAPGPVFSLELPEVTPPASRVRFYRAW
jgi:hypothetical protein